jgi:hypothetical protein
MRSAVLSLSCFLAAGTLFAQQTAPASSAKSATTPQAASAKPALTAPAQPVEKLPEHPLTDDQAEKLLVILGADKAHDEVKEGMLNLVHSRMPFAPKDVSDDFQQSFDKMTTKADIIAVYKRHFSVADADALIAFSKTPAGKDVIEMLPNVLQQSEQAAVNLGRKTAQEVVDRHRPEIEAAAKQYQQEHQPRQAPSLGAPPSSTTPQSSTPAPKPSAPATTTPQPQ